MSDLKTALVTGGRPGIGWETAILSSKEGLNVVICSRTQEEKDSAMNAVGK